MDRRFVLLGLFAVAGCASLPPPRLATRQDVVFEELEPLYLAHAGPDGLTIRVASKGCTARADFTFHRERNRLAFARKAVDACRSAGGLVDLTFTWAELGLPRGAEVALLNPLVP